MDFNFQNGHLFVSDRCSYTMEEIRMDNDDSTVVLRCLMRLLTPFSPQTATRQTLLFHQYIQILHQHQLKLQTARTPIDTGFGLITSDGLVNLEWVKPLIDCTTIATFPGLALSTMAYGTVSHSTDQQHQVQLQSFLGGGEQPLSPAGEQTHPVFPSEPCHLIVWDELQQILMDVLSKSNPYANYSHFGLFSNENTNNGKPSLLSSEEPFIVRLGLQNPFPFQLILRNLCLSLDQLRVPQLKLRLGCSPPFSDKFNCSIISEVIVPPLVTDQQPTAILQKKNTEFVDLHVLPSPEVEHFAVNGVKFELCSPFDESKEKNNCSTEVGSSSISAFVPISVRGKRLSKTKDQRMCKQYGVDKRLSASVCSYFGPLLSFNPIGGDPGFIKAITHWRPLEAFCDQIVQVVFEIENVGKCAVDQLRFSTNLSEQVSISEPSDGQIAGRWTQCPAKLMQTDDPSRASQFGMNITIVGHFGKISKNNPMEVGQKIGMRVAIRVKEKAQSFFFLFLYLDENGRSRQFRFSVRTRPLSRIFEVDHYVLNQPIGLSMLKLRCLPFSSCESDVMTKRTTFTKLDLLRLSIKLADANVKAMVRRVDSEPIQLEHAMEQNLCFYISKCGPKDEEEQFPAPETPLVSNCGIWTDVWLGKTYVPDFPEWKIVEIVERTPEISGIEQKREMIEAKKLTADVFQMKLLWKASIIRGDGTVNNVFGELLKYCRNEMPIG